MPLLTWMVVLAFAQDPSPEGGRPADEAVVAAPVDARIALVGAQVWDAVDGLRAVESIVIDGDRILSVGPLPADLPATRVRDLGGATIIPGLMDMHVHLGLIPGGRFRDDDPEALARRHLRAYVASGVTTVLDTGILPDDARMLRRLAAEQPAPELFFLGPLVSPPGGYVSVVLPEFPPAATAADVADQFAAFDDIGTVGVKATLEEGMFVPVWPTYNDEVVGAIFDQAEQRGIGVYAHAMSAKEVRWGLDLGVDGFVHPTQSPRRKIVRTLAERQTWVTSTLSVFDHTLIEFEPDRLDRPLFALVVPPEELATARDPEAWAASKDIVIASVLPDRHGPLPKVARKLLDKPGLTESRRGRMGRSVLTQHQAGVPILLGSDSGNWPVFLTEFHGPTTLRELELLVDAGLTETEALTAATWTPARMLGIDGEVGRIAPGYRADLVILADDVTTDIAAIWDATLVVRAGTIDTPAGWMEH